MDREKLIRAWEIFRESNPFEICNGREFRAFTEPEYCMGQMIEDTIAMLKEQEVVTVHDPGAYCPACGWMLYPEDHPHNLGIADRS